LEAKTSLILAVVVGAKKFPTPSIKLGLGKLV